MTRSPDDNHNFPELAELYPDVAAVGSLAAAVQRVAVEHGLALRGVIGNESRPFEYASVPRMVPACQSMSIGAGRTERSWFVYARAEQIELVRGSTQNLLEVARAAAAWQEGASLLEIQRVAPFVEISELAKAYDKGPDELITQCWRALRTDGEESGWPEYRDLIEAAYAEPRLRRLRPYTSHWALHFLAGSGDPPVVSYVWPFRDGRPYQVRSLGRAIIGEADTPEGAVALVLSRLPDGSGQAVASTRPAQRWPDLLWEDVKTLFDPVRMGSVAVVRAGKGSVARWQNVFHLLSDGDWAWSYSEGGVVAPPPSAADVFSRAADAGEAVLRVWPAPALPATFRLLSPTEIRCDIDVREIRDQESFDILCHFLTTLGNVLITPVLLAPETDDTVPILGFDASEDSVVLLPASGLI